MELHAVCTLEAEGLIRVGGRACESNGAVGKVERVAVPLQRHELVGCFAEDGIRAGLAGQTDGQQPDLGLGAGVDPGSE